MKQNEFITLGLIIFISAVLAWFGGNLILNPDETKQTPIEVLQPISSEFTIPSEQIFNENSLNFTERITIGENSSEAVFD